MADPTRGPYGSLPLDNFNRADGDPGTSWVGSFAFSEAKPNIASNQIDTAGAWESMRWSVATSSADCEVWGRPAGGAMNLWARASSTLGVTGGGYCVYAYAGGTLQIQKLVGATPTALAFGPQLAGGTPVGLGVNGSHLEAFYWDGAKWVLGCSASDSTFSTAGYIGIDGIGTFDNFGGGATGRLNLQQALETGIVPVYAAVSYGIWSASNSGRMVLHFKNTGASDAVIAIQAPGRGSQIWAQTGGHPLADRLVPVPATTGNVMAGPFPPPVYNTGIVSAGQTSSDITFTLNNVAGLSVAAFQVGNG